MDIAASNVQLMRDQQPMVRGQFIVCSEKIQGDRSPAWLPAELWGSQYSKSRGDQIGIDSAAFDVDNRSGHLSDPRSEDVLDGGVLVDNSFEFI